MKKLTMKRSHDLTFEEGCNMYLDYCKARNLREGTIKHYKESIKSIYRYIEPTISINSFDKDTMNSFIIDMKDNLDVKDTTLYTYARDLKTLMYFFMDNQLMDTFKIHLMKIDKEPIECYSDNELFILLKKPNMKQCSFSEFKTWVIINFLLSTGIRMNSLINIKIKDIDFDNEVVHIRVTKNRKLLIIPLNNIIIKILHDYLSIRQHDSNDDYLFCNVFGKQLTKSTLYQSLYNYHLNHGVNKTGVHRYRHTFAKKWVLSGGNIVTLQKILGHSSLAITENYLNMLTTDIKKDIDKFNILNEFVNKQYINISQNQ